MEVNVTHPSTEPADSFRSSPNQKGDLIQFEQGHSDFYYKLEALNEKIKIFKEIFYSSKRDDARDKQMSKVREKHRALLFA